jgi:hypothetical protein
MAWSTNLLSFTRRLEFDPSNYLRKRPLDESGAFRLFQRPLAISKVVGLFVVSLQFVPRGFHSLAMIFLAAREG